MPFASNIELTTTRGVAHIQDLVLETEEPYATDGRVDKYRVAAGQYAYAYNCETGEHAWAPITEYSVHRQLKMKAVMVGRQRPVLLTVSDDHSLLAYTDSGRVEKVRPDDSMGLMVPVAKKIGDPGIDELREVAACDSISYASAFGDGRSTRDRACVLPLDETFGRFIGALIGDGWVDNADHIYIATNYAEISDIYRRFVDDEHSPFAHGSTSEVAYSRESYTGGRKTARRTQASCSWFARWLRKAIGSGAQNKRIPTWCLNAPKAHILALLDGLLSTDGTVTLVQAKNKSRPQLQVGYDTTSPDLLNSLMFILRRLGVSASATPYRGKHSNFTCYRINLSGMDIKRLVLEQGFTLTSQHKNDTLQAGIMSIDEQSPIASRMDLVPYPRHVHQRVLDALPGRADKQTASAARKAGYWSRNTASRYTNALRDVPDQQMADYVRLVDDLDVTWRQVLSVEDVTETLGYDITVPGPYTFATADGVFVQDTINIHVPASDKAVDNALETLLPSRNLISAADFGPRMLPMQDYVLGLYLASTPDKRKSVREFDSKEQALEAYKKGKIGPRDPIRIKS